MSREREREREMGGRAEVGGRGGDSEVKRLRGSAPDRKTA
jgi:hypothetical protein